MVSYTQDGSQFSTVLYSERERVSIHTGIQTLKEKPIEGLDMREAINYLFFLGFLIPLLLFYDPWLKAPK